MSIRIIHKLRAVHKHKRTYAELIVIGFRSCKGCLVRVEHIPTRVSTSNNEDLSI